MLFPLAAALAMFAVISKARPGFINTFFGNLFDTFSHFPPKFLNKSPKLSACIGL